MNTTCKDTELKERLQGYSKCMLIWAVLRFAIGVLVLVKYLQDMQYPGGIYVWVIIALIFGLSVYLFVVGRLGYLAYSNRTKLKLFFVMSIVGLVIAGGMLGLYLYWQLNGYVPNGRDLFSTAVDFVLYATGVFYAWRLSNSDN